jgi:hypothetical protein
LADSVRCTQDSNHAFTCQVELGPEPAAPDLASASSPPVASATAQPVGPAPEHAENPAVASLVRRYETVVLPAVSQSYLTASAVTNCAANEASILLALAVKAGPVAVLAAIKAGFEASKCLSIEHNNAMVAASVRERADYCAERGGTVTSVVDDNTYCEVPAGAK